MEHLEALRQQHEVDVPLLESFVAALRTELSQIAREHNVALAAQIEGRVKTWRSISEKVARKDLSLTAIRSLSDLCGLRLLLLFKPDVPAMCQAIRNHFDVLEEYDTADRLAPDQFGYSSYHQIIALRSDWLRIPSYSHFGGLRAEVQTRTIAQHIWAAASHELQYKRESSVPDSIRRSIHRVSALLETADFEFERLLITRQQYTEQLQTQANSAQELDVDTLRVLLEDEWDNRYQRNTVGLAELLDDLKHFKFDTPERVHALIRRQRTAIEKEDREVVATIRVGARSEQAGKKRWVDEHGTYYTTVGMTRGVLARECGDEYRRYKGWLAKAGDTE